MCQISVYTTIKRYKNKPDDIKEVKSNNKMQQDKSKITNSGV